MTKVESAGRPYIGIVKRMSSEKVKFSFRQMKEEVIELTLTEFLQMMTGADGEDTLTAEQHKNYSELFVKLLKRKDSTLRLRDDKKPWWVDTYSYEDDNHWFDDVIEYVLKEVEKPKRVRVKKNTTGNQARQ